jgi:hypothetical protein
MKKMDPIMFHVPMNGVLEWATVEDSGRLLANVCGDDIPEEFWRRFYNIGSGEEYRVTNFEFEEMILGTLGIGSPRKLFDPNWFILQNFHGQWYTDADELEKYLGFRYNVPIKKYFGKLAKQTPAVYRFTPLAPLNMVKKYLMGPIVNTPLYGTKAWVDNGIKDRITAYYGSYEKYDAIGSWDEFEVIIPDKNEMSYLDHGYDESKDFHSLKIGDMKKAAQTKQYPALWGTLRPL